MLANEELDEGINFNQISSQVCMIAGTAAGGVLVAIAPGLAIGLDLLSFFLSACLIGAMKVEEHLDMAITQNNYWENLKGGVLYFCKNNLFLLFVSGALLSNALATILSSLSAAYISGTLNKSSEYLARAAGFFNSAGSAIMPVLSFLLAGIVHYIKIPMIFLGTGIFSLLLLFLFKISRCGDFFDREISKLK